MKICLISAAIIISFFANHTFAQINLVYQDSIYTSNFLRTSLFNDINLANLNSVLNYSNKFNKVGISVENYYLSNVSKLGQNFFRDYNNFRFLVFYNLKKNLNAGIGFQNRFLTDDKNVETNKNNSNYIYTDLDYILKNNIFFNSKLGIKSEDQIGEFNTGFSGLISTEADNFLYKDYLANGKLILFYENLIQKQNHNYDINAGIFKKFTSQTDNTGTIRYFNQRNDIFFPATLSVINQYNVKNNIEKRIENYFQIGDNLNYSLNSRLNFSLTGSFMNRNITKEFKYRASSTNILFENVYDTKILETNLEFSAGLYYNRTKLISQLKFAYDERSENHSLINTAGLLISQITELEKAEKNKNNNSRRTSVLLNTLYLISNTNSFGVIGSGSLLRYDTDFDQNYDDRDELESIFSAFHRYNNLLNFNIETRFDLIFSRLSYIFSQRSANNYKNRIYKLTSQSTFTPVRQLSTRNFVQVLANYTIYDFEDIVSDVQSFSYRQLNAKDSTTFNISNGFALDFIGELKFYEQAQFNDKNFSVKPIAYFVEQLYLPGVSYLINYLVKVGAGYKFFEQKRYQYENSAKQLANTYISYGPAVNVNFYLNHSSVINFTGGIDFIKYDNNLQNNSSISLQLNILWNI